MNRRIRLFSALGAALVALPAVALLPAPVEVRTLVQMPLAVTEVVELGVPPRDVERVVVRLNEAAVPVVDTVEIVRYSAFPLVVDTYRPPETLLVDLPWDLGDLDMSLLVDTHFDDGLRGDSLAEAILFDLVELGFLLDGDRWAAAPMPVERDFVYYVVPGFRFDADAGLFRDRLVTIDRDFVVDRDRWYVRRDFDVAAVRDVEVIDLDGRDVDRIVVRDADGRRGVPPGHAMHDADGPHPTPGHVKHHVPGGPPGHVKHDDDGVRRRAVVDDRRSRDGRPARAARPADRGKPAKAGKPGQGGGQGKARGGGPGQGGGQGKAKADKPGKGKGGGQGGGGQGKGGGKGKGGAR